ncbi:MAG: flagellar basal body rod C-terminal domain-containing protein, partial [Myxococcota bacterium]|nr:flagellar basal body rod C-terminal domain-containing protein [Myxococcota bacterium]
DDPANPAVNPAAELAGDNTQVLAMADLITSTIVMNGKTLQATFDEIVQSIAQETQAADIGVFTEDASVNQLSNLLVAETAVSIDEEMIQMTLANQAFEAAGMIVRNVDEMAETLLRLVG